MRLDDLIIRRVYRGLKKRKLHRRAGKMAYRFTIPISNGLIHREHIQALGPAWWLLHWFIDRTTYEEPGPDGETWGYVLGNKEVSVERIAGEVDLPAKTVRKHLARLVTAGYVQTFRGRYGLHIRVAKSKKYKRPEYPKRGNLAPEYPKEGNLAPEYPNQGTRLPRLGHQSTPDRAISVPQSGQSAARMTVQKTIQRHDSTLRAGAREGTADINLPSDQPRGSETGCTQEERERRRKAAATLPAWMKK